MEADKYLEAARALCALWPTGRPSPALTEAETIELRAIWREAHLEEWLKAIRRLADEERRLRPHVSDLRAAVRHEMRENREPKRRQLPRLPERIEPELGPGRVAQLRRKLAETQRPA